MPIAISDVGSAVLDGKLYSFGGIEQGTDLAAVARSFAYDPTAGANGRWESIPNLPAALWGPCGVAAKGKLFSFGGAPANSPYMSGKPASDSIFVYEPGKGWRDLTAREGVRCPYTNWAMGGAYDPETELIYCVGGASSDDSRSGALDRVSGTVGTTDQSRIWTFDPNKEAVVDPDVARLPQAKRWPTVARVSVDGRSVIHAICGIRGGGGPTRTNHRLDVRSGTVQTMHPAPASGFYATTDDCVIDGRVHLTHGLFWKPGGDLGASDYRLFHHRYDPAADRFETDLPKPNVRRAGSASGVIDGRLTVAGGHVKRYAHHDLHDTTDAVATFTP